MARQRKSQKVNALPPEVLTVEKLAHDGRGIAHRADGKLVFVDGALPGEQVEVRITQLHKKFDEARTTEVFVAAAERVPADCAHFGVCGGCSLQHMQGFCQ